MKFIEENFSDTYVLNLSNDEIRYLNRFLEEQISIDSVECISLKPIYKEIDRRYYDDIYCSIDIKIIVNNDINDLESIERSIGSARRRLPFIDYIPTNEFDFEITKVNDFIKDSIFIKSWNERDIVSSYILFDRNGTFEKLQDELSKTKDPWFNLSRIGNIDELRIDPYYMRLTK